MNQLNEEMINHPAKEEYSFNFGGGIFGDYAAGQNTHMYELVTTQMSPNEMLMKLDMPENSLKQIEYKVNINDTLEEAVRRVLKETFGLEEIFNFEHKFSKSNPSLVYIRAVCRNSALNGRKLGDLNLYWYQIS